MSNNQKIFSSIIEYFNQNFTIAMSGVNNLKLDGKTHTPQQFHVRFNKDIHTIGEFIGKSEFYRLVEDFQRTKNWKEDRTIEHMASKVFAYFKTTLSKEAREKVVKSDTSELLNHLFDYSSMIPILDTRSNQRMLYDARTNHVAHELSYESWKEWVATRPSEDKKIILQTVSPALISYDPYKRDEYTFEEISGQKEVVSLNAHLCPDWRKEELDPDATLPKMFDEFMKYLFPDKESLDYVYHWMNFMLTGRNHCYLILHGQQGIGKNTLASICSKLVGFSNYGQVGVEFFDARFNGEMKYKRLMYFDDVVITRENVLSLRSMTNTYIAIEQKGLQRMTMRNHCSYIISNNLESKNYISYEDRRYSIPVMAEKKIISVFGHEWLDKFNIMIEEDENFIKQIGSWVINHGDRGNYNSEHRLDNNRFFEVVEKGLALWQLNVIQMIESRANEEYDLMDMKDILGKTGRTTLANFLSNHMDREGDEYGYLLQKKGGARYLRVHEKYRPEELKFSDEVEEEAEQSVDIDQFNF